MWRFALPGDAARSVTCCAGAKRHMSALDRLLSTGMRAAQRDRLCGVPFTLSERRASRGLLVSRARRTLAAAGVGVRKPRRLGAASKKGRAFTLMNPV